jgi:soluble lytic murein transglycosylase-like protein
MRGASVLACLAAALFIWHATYDPAPPAGPSEIPTAPAEVSAPTQAWESSAPPPSAARESAAQEWGSNRNRIFTGASFVYPKNHPATPLPALAFAAMTTTAAPMISAIEPVGDEFGSYGESTEAPFDVSPGRLQVLSRGGLCNAIVSVARANDLPIAFFANLIWQESSFQSKTISHAGALGIAQFIPETAIEHGLMNPFEPLHALFAAGKLLRKLNDRFGNLGLAAAAYNAGPQRVSAWLAERRTLPGETRAYVVRITGHQAYQWLSSEFARGVEATLMPAKAPCAEVAEDVKAQAGIVRVSRLMSELAAATAPAPQKQLRIASPLASRAKRDENKPDGKVRAVSDIPLPPQQTANQQLANQQQPDFFAMLRAQLGGLPWHQTREPATKPATRRIVQTPPSMPDRIAAR